MLTDFGKVCRRLRLEVNENLGDMADRLGMKPSFLSAIENGKKNVPKTLCESIKKEYSLTNEQYTELAEAAEASRLQIKIQMKDMQSSDRNLVLSFARKFEELDNNEKEKIMRILQGEDK